MPSRDKLTGRRLSGAGQARLKAERQAQTQPPVKAPALALAPERSKTTVTAQLLAIPAPPLSEGVVSVSEWAMTRVLPVCVRLAEQAQDLTRVRVLQQSVGKLGKMRDKTVRCEQALIVRADRQGQIVDVLSPDPPLGDAIAILPWAYYRLASSIYACARDEHFSRDQYLSIADACAATGLIPPNAAIDALIEALDPRGS